MLSYFVYGPQCLLYFILIHLILLFLAYILIFYIVHRNCCTVWIFAFILAFNAAILFSICMFHFCPYGYKLLICLCVIYVHVYLYLVLYLCSRSNWLQKREWYRACDCIGSLSLPLGVYRRFLGFSL